MPETRRALHPSDLQCLLAICLALILLSPFAAACTSRAISRPMPTPTTAATTPPRPNITFPIFSCPPTYAAWYCLNDATCFTVEIHNEILYNCECAIGFMGPRCEYKEIDGSYLPTRRTAMLETASIASGVMVALFAVLILIYICYMHHEKKQKLKSNENTISAHQNEGMDEVDGMTRVPVLRPFGDHHSPILPMDKAFRR